MTETRPVYHADIAGLATERRRALTYAALNDAGAAEAGLLRLVAERAQQQPTAQAEAIRRQYSGDRIVAHLRQAAQAHAAKVRVVLSDGQMADIDRRRADGESWAGLARAYGMTQTTLMAAYARQTAAKRQE